MPRPIKLFESGELYFITSRTEEGIVFPATEEFEKVTFGIVARAQKLYPVKIVGMKLMGNHLHALLVPIDPEMTPLFVGYVKQELAHEVNRRLKRRKRTVWCEGYDSPVLLGKEEALHYMVYIYTQAQSAHLVESAEEYPGASTWKMFLDDKSTSDFLRVRRRIDATVAEEINTLEFSPYAWCQRHCPEIASDAVKAEVLRRVRCREVELTKERRRLNIAVLGRERLRQKKVDLKYLPKKFGKRMVCICRDITLRKQFLLTYRLLRIRAREVLTLWRSGSRSVPWPLGLFPPSLPRHANSIRALAICA